MGFPSLRGALATKQSRICLRFDWIASLTLAMTINFDARELTRLIGANASATIE
jgi:hypothetical protein